MPPIHHTPHYTTVLLQHPPAPLPSRLPPPPVQYSPSLYSTCSTPPTTSPLKKQKATRQGERGSSAAEHDVGGGGCGRGRGGGAGADADLEGAGEQQAPGAPAEGHRRQDFHRPPRARQLQAAQALRQQRGAQGAVPRGGMGRRGRRHHIPKGMQAAAGDAEPVLVLAAAERAVLELPEPGAVVPRQPGVVELPEPHAPRPQQRQQHPPGRRRRIPASVPPRPAQPPAAPRLQLRARHAAALLADGGVAAAHQGPQARLGRRRRRPLPPPLLRRLRPRQPHPRAPARAPGHHPRVRRVRRLLHRRLRPLDQLPDGAHHRAGLAHLQPRPPGRRLQRQLHGAGRRDAARGDRRQSRPAGVRVRQGPGHAVGRREDPRGRRRGARAHARRRRQVKPRTFHQLIGSLSKMSTASLQCHGHRVLAS